ncbi:MAG: hypothetical protein ACK4ND_05265 [Cytophagaceae bacterium]
MEDPIHDFEQEKETLSRRTKLYEAALTDELDDLKEDIKGIGTKALLIGGGALVAYFVFKKIFSKKGKKEKGPQKVVYADPNTQMIVQQPKEESAIVKMIKEHIALFIIGIVKEKLAAYIREAELKYIAKANEPQTNGRPSKVS